MKKEDDQIEDLKKARDRAKDGEMKSSIDERLKILKERKNVLK